MRDRKIFHIDTESKTFYENYKISIQFYLKIKSSQERMPIYFIVVIHNSYIIQIYKTKKKRKISSIINVRTLIYKIIHNK